MTPQPRTHIDPETRREAILDAVEELLLESDDPRGPSVTAIAGRAGVSKGLVYWLFESRDAIFVGIAERLVARRDRDLERVFEARSTIDDQLRAIAEAYERDPLRVATLWGRLHERGVLDHGRIAEARWAPIQRLAELWGGTPEAHAVAWAVTTLFEAGREALPDHAPAPESLVPLARSLLAGSGLSVASLPSRPVEPDGAPVVEGFRRRLGGDGGAAVAGLDAAEAVRAGEEAAEQLIAGLRWSEIVGERLDTNEIGTLLGISRQALAQRQRSGSVLGLRGRTTTWYPAWQLDTDARRIRPEVRLVVAPFRDRLDDDYDPLLVASWATTPQLEDLDGATPARWMQEGGDLDRLVIAAERAAARLAQ